jgi:alanyl-tRNA synthetase
MVNEKIRENIPVVIRSLPKEEAMKTGAMALFGEKYGDTVRVVTIDPGYSIELCGGTHVGATGELGLFIISSEAAVAAGVRRIEALSGEAAYQHYLQSTAQLKGIREALKNPADSLKALTALSEENTQLRRQLEKIEQGQLRILAETLTSKVQTIGEFQFLGAVVEVPSADALKKLAFDLKGRLTKPVIVLAAAVEGKASVVISIDDEAVKIKNLDAGQLIRQQVAPLIKGGGGGQKTLATAGGQDASALQQVIEAVKTQL